MAHGTHDFADDPRNAEILIHVNGELVPRAQAVVSVFDAGFVLGDGVWEGLRVSAGHPAFLDQHLDRLWEGAAAIALDIGLTPRRADRADLRDARGQRHDRRRPRPADGDPRAEVDAVPGPALVGRPGDGRDHRRAQGPAAGDRRARACRCSPCTCAARTPDTLDPKLNAHSKLNDITACIQAYTAGADEALMLDPHGFVATCNSHALLRRTHAARCGPRRAVLPRRHHPRQRAARLPRGRHPRAARRSSA